MYQLGVFHSHPVHFCHCERQCTSGDVLFSSGTFRPFRAKFYQLGISLSQPVQVGHFGRKCTGWGFFVLSRDTFGNLGPKCTG